jgi:hypothetical protein
VSRKAKREGGEDPLSLSLLTVEEEGCTRSDRQLKRSLLNKKDRLLEETGLLYSLKIPPYTYSMYLQIYALMQHLKVLSSDGSG